VVVVKAVPAADLMAPAAKVAQVARMVEPVVLPEAVALMKVAEVNGPSVLVARTRTEVMTEFHHASEQFACSLDFHCPSGASSEREFYGISRNAIASGFCERTGD
jgi:hypothetical protein